MRSLPQVGQWCEANTTSVRSAKRVDGLGEVAGPAVRVAHQRAAQRQQVVQVVGGVLGHAQRAEAAGSRSASRRAPRCPGAIWNSISTPSMVCVSPVSRMSTVGTIRATSPVDADLAQPAADLPLRAAVQRGAVHVGGPARHRGAGVDVLLHGVFGEVLRRDDGDLAGVDVGLRRHAEHATEVVDVAVGVDDRDHRAVAAVCAIQRQRGRRGLGGDQRVDHDDPGVAFDEADVRQVEAADLIDALDHFVEALLGAQLGLPPQARDARTSARRRPRRSRRRCPTPPGRRQR